MAPPIPPGTQFGACNNRSCHAGCSVFLVDESPGAAPVQWLTPCLVCGCYASQHRQDGPKPQMPPVMDEEPERSSTESTMMGSRSPRGPSVPSTSPIPHPNIFQNHFDSGAFRAAAENRTRKMAAEEESGFSFRPAARAKVSVDQDIPGFKKRKKDAAAAETKHKKHAVSDTRSKKSSKSTSAQQTFTMVLVEGTKAVARGEYRKPNASKIGHMADQGYVKSLAIDKNAGETAIKDAVNLLFKPVYLANTLPLAPTWSLLRVATVTQGAAAKLEHSLPRGTIDFQTLLRCLNQSTIRDAGPAFKKPIFFVLASTHENLPLTLPVMSDEDKSSEHESGADQSMGEGDDTNNDSEQEMRNPSSGPSNARGPMDSEPINASDTGDIFEASYSKWQMDHKTELYPDSHKFLLRLILNMHKPDAVSVLWAQKVMPSLQSLQEGQAFLHEWFKRCEYTGGSIGSSVTELSVLFREYFVDRIAPLLALCAEHPDLAYSLGSDDFESRFDQLFTLGPGGLTFILDTLDRAYHLVHGDKLPMTDVSIEAQGDIYRAACGVSEKLLSCVEHLRLKHSRFLWDPKGFRQFGARYEALHHRLSVATVEDWQATCLGSVRIHGLDTLRIGLIHALQTAFGSAIEQRSMIGSALLSGEYGLPRFYSKIVAPILDHEDHTHQNYGYHFLVMQECCIALAKKLDNDSKTRKGKGKAKAHTEDSGSKPENNDGPANATRGRRTRNDMEYD